METGARVGKYSVGRKLGQGGFGVLFAARDTELDRELAIKFLRPEHVLRPQVVQRFLQEARAAARINHPGIVTVFECGQVSGTNTRADGTVYIAMELLAGETLSLRIKRERLPLATALAFTRQLAGALAAAHASGIVHRDLKPQNVFLVPDPATVGGERVKVLDFGIAKLADGFGSNVQTQSMEMLGTPMYMSPEQCKSSAKVDTRSDIYSLGCILFELACGRPPFDGDSGELIAKHQLVPPPLARELVPGLPPALDHLLAAMLAKSPDDRPQTMEAVIAGLDAAAAEADGRAPMAALPPGAGDETVTTVASAARRRGLGAVLKARRAIVLGAGVAIAAGIVLGVATTRGGSTPAAAVDTRLAGPPLAPDATVAIATEPTPIDAALAPVEPANIDPNCDPDALREAGTQSEGLGQHAKAVEQFEASYRCKADVHTNELAFMAACNAGAVPKARAFWQRMSIERQNKVSHICARNHILREQLDEPGPSSEDAKRLASECLSHVADRRWGDVGLCADKLAELDPAKADELREKMHAETAADIAKGKMEAELATGNLARARKYLDQIRDDSVYKQEAQKEYAAAEDKLVEDFRARAQRAKGKCAEIDIVIHQASAVSSRAGEAVKAFRCSAPTTPVKNPPPSCDADALRDAGTQSEGLGQHAAAVKQFEQSLQCKPDTHVVELAFMAACNAVDVAKARTYWKKMSAARQQLTVQICKRNHITAEQLDAP